jgi:adenosylcobalamin-dependent ribonucleoside-diphosphate reductase
MVQPKASTRNALHELGYKIFLDRYAQKDMTRETLAVGDTVIVVVNPQTGQREIGTVQKINLPKVTVKLNDGEVVERDLEHVDKPLETDPGQMMDRVARGIAAIEKTPELQDKWTKEFRWLLDDWKFVPGGRILSAAGTEQELTFYNCFVLPCPSDSREGIMTTLTYMTEIMSRGGGVGINISSLRPRHAYVKGVNGRSSGSVSWGALYSFVTGLIEQGGCFGPDERIMTDKGLIPAAELADRMDAGETFHAHTHRGLRTITARFRNGIKPLYEVTTDRGYKVRITEDHKVAVLMDGEITTMPLKYLQAGDEILLLLGSGNESSEVVLKPVEYERSIMSTTLNTDVKIPETLNPDLAYFIGYSIGDGYVQMGKKVNWEAPKALKLATSDSHPSIRERLINIVHEQFGLNANIQTGDGACTIVAIYSRMMIEWLIQNNLLKAKAQNIRVPEVIFRSPSSVQLAFIAGYFDADGSNRKRKGGYGIDSISLEMLQEIQMLLGLNGIASRIHTTERPQANWQTIYRLTVTGSTFRQRFAQLVPAEKVSPENGKRDMYNTYPATVWTSLGERSKYHQRIYDGQSTRISTTQLEKIGTRLKDGGRVESAERIKNMLNTLPDTITSITLLGDSEVYDFEVDDVHLVGCNSIYTHNSRRGALMLILNDWHPDVFDFINSKRQMGQITNANISVGVSDKLMDAVKNDGDWDLMFPDTTDTEYDNVWDGDIDSWAAAGRKVIHYKTVKARDVWNAIIESAWASAEPGLWFRERSNKMANSWYYNPIISTNPCGEEPLGGWSVCNLGAINLAKFYSEEKHDVDWELLEKTVRAATRFLDNVIDATPYFFEQNREVQLSERRVGLGTMGVAELIISLGIRYGSDESVEFIEKLYKAITLASYETSIELAAEKGAFPQFNAEKFLESGFMLQMPQYIRDMVAQKGIRNVTLLTQAPTGTTGTLVNTSTGIEPFFSWKYYRKSRLGLHEEQVPIVSKYFEEHPDATELPEYFVTAMDLAPREHVKVQGAFQKWIDAAISKTCNVPNDYTVEQVSELYLYMYELGCKGGTIYRDGSRDEQVLMLKGDERAETEMQEVKGKKEKPEKQEPTTTPHRVYPRPNVLNGTTVRFNTPFGKSYITMNSDELGNPFEVFITVGKAGSDIQADAEALGRMISLQLRTTAPHNRREMLKLIVEQLQDIGGARPVGFGPKRILSLPDAVGRALMEHYINEEAPQQLGLPINGGSVTPKKVSPPVEDESDDHDELNGNGFMSGADMCPECGTISLIRAEGCRKCLTCGYSEC